MLSKDQYDFIFNDSFFSKQLYEYYQNYKKENPTSNLSYRILRDEFNNILNSFSKKNNIYVTNYSIDDIKNILTKSSKPKRKIRLKDVYCFCNYFKVSPDKLFFGIAPQNVNIFYSFPLSSKGLKNFCDVHSKIYFYNFPDLNLSEEIIKTFMYYILNHFRNVSKLTSLVDNVSFQERGHNQISLFYEKYIKEYSPLKSIINEKVIGSIEERDLLYDELQCIFNLDLYDISSVDEFYILTSSAEIEEFSYDLSNCFLQRQLGNIKNLKYGKLKKGTNQELADIFNVSQSYISNLTSMSLFDKCNPEITILAKIACYFEISLTELIFQTNENNIEYRYFHDDIEVKNKYGDYFKDSNYFNIINSFFSHADFSNLYFSYLNYIILTFYYLGILKKNYYSSYDEDLVFPITTDMFENIDEYISLEQDQHSKRSRFSGLSYFDCSENIYNYYLNAVINIFVRIIYDIEIQLKEN